MIILNSFITLLGIIWPPVHEGQQPLAVYSDTNPLPNYCMLFEYDCICATRG